MEVVNLFPSFQRQFRGSAPVDSILPLQALRVGTKEVPHSTHVALLGSLMDVLASGRKREYPRRYAVQDRKTLDSKKPG